MSSHNQVTLTDLNALIQNASHPDINNFDALMKAMFGLKATAIKIFKCLLCWMPHAKRFDGGVYKSAIQLAEETASSTASVDRAQPHLKTIGFDVVVRKANGSPTRHYYLNLERFLGYLAELFGATVAQVRAWMWGEALPQDDRNHSLQDDRNHSLQDDRNDSIKVGETLATKNTDTITQTQIQTPTTTETVVVRIKVPQIVTDAVGTSICTGYMHKEEEVPLTEAVQDLCQRLDTDATTLNNWILSYGWERVQKVVAYGEQLTFTGGIDKFVVRNGSRDDIRRELEYKMQPLLRDGGGITFGLDHRIPDGTPLESYRFYVDTARQMLGLPARDWSSTGWARMAM